MRLLILIIPFLCFNAKAAEDNLAEFSVIPNECITTEKGDTCELPLAITYPKLSSKVYCLLIGEERLGCWPNHQLPTTFTVELRQDSTFTLKDEKGNKSTSVVLKLKYRKASMYRRRVRNPWSLF